MIQLTFEFAELVEPSYTRAMAPYERFAAFHAANPHIADALEALAAQWLTFNDRASMKAIYERLRWESGIRADGEPYELDNTYTAYYARLLIARRPEWAPAFALRKSAADGTAA